MPLSTIRFSFDNALYKSLGKFFNEFVVKSPIPVDELNEKLLENKILGGYDLGKDYEELKGCVLMCVTEKRTAKEIDNLVNLMEGM